jgi:hypothetical protein
MFQTGISRSVAVRAALCGAILVAVVPLTVASASTTFTGGEVFSGGDWTNGLPSPGNDGTINVSGTFGAPNFDFNQPTAGNVIISQTGGSLTPGSLDFNVRNDASGGATYSWNQSGGSLTARLVIPNNRVTYTLSGTGTLQALGTGGDRILTANSGVFAQTGGTSSGLGLDIENGSTVSLSGGSAVHVGEFWGDGFVSENASTIAFSGNYTATIDPAVSAANSILLSSGGLLSFNPDWKGSITHDDMTLGQWETSLEQIGVTVGGIQVTSGNFNSLFLVEDAGVAGSSVELVTPEPSSLVALCGLAAAGLVFVSLRRRKA